MRLFVGIPLADGVVSELSAAVEHLRPKAGALRWTTPASWHVTLQFLGSCTEEQDACLVACLAGVRTGQVAIRIMGLGCFERAGILHAEVEPSPQLIALQQRITAATSRCGFAAEQRPFHPHITLARAQGEGHIVQWSELMARIGAQPAYSSFTADAFMLYESHLLKTGAEYEIRVRFPLAD